VGLYQRYAEQAEPEVARAIRETDMILLKFQLSRFEQKRDYWRMRDRAVRQRAARCA
jgi:hypothetical protein